MKKNYVLDTNILIHCPTALFGFDDNNVLITTTTLQELDSKKTAFAEVGYGARESIRNIESVEGDYAKGVTMPNGGTFIIAKESEFEKLIPAEFSLDRPDNRIINCVLGIAKQSELETILVTNDISMRINATMCGCVVQGYHNEMILDNENYTGRRDISPEDIESPFNKGFIENEFGICKDGSNSALYTFKTDGWHLLKDRDFYTPYCQPRNVGQRFALYALLASPDVLPLVILKGSAGTAKTFLALAAGLQGYYHNGYDRIMITRSNTLSDNDLGFLPGDLEEKMTPLIAPFMDNLQVLLKGQNEEKEQIKIQIEDMFETGILEICSLAYMRGRSLVNSYIIVDEAQNCTIGQILEIITRAGKGSKVVLLGDPDQIDSPKLDRKNNGLTFAAERMKGSTLCAQITFEESETVRSPLAAEGAKRLVVK